ncbi:hypothetical protein [Fructobacillus tropaeoli]|uniref:hypothetical protein n=1 Tax=Fructobacillus tropaeoli TaxID=709323 RepID=UPI002D8EA4AA|nr:unnamed protein product [Fructobacillus tropaeoli]
MGQRTQMLLKVHILDEESSKKETVYLAYHYQFGFGRVMPMGFLNLATHLAMGLRYEEENFEKAVEQLAKVCDPYTANQYVQVNISEELPEDEQAKEEVFQNPHKGGFDNNNGWLCATLYVVTRYQHFYLEDGSVKFYRGIEEDTTRYPVGTQMSIESWQTAFSDFCTKKWLIGYKNLLSAYNIDFPYTPKQTGARA